MSLISLDEVYRSYHDKVYWFVMKKIPDAEISQDLTSDIFLKIAEHLDSYDPEKAQLSTWIYTIANRTIYDYFRTRKVYSELPEESGEDGRYPVALIDEDGPEEYVLEEEELGRLTACLMKLDQRERDLVILHYYYQLTLKDIAQKMGISYVYAKVLHKKTLKLLRESMNWCALERDKI